MNSEKHEPNHEGAERKASQDARPVDLTRRRFIGLFGASSLAAFAWPNALGSLIPIVGVDNPLQYYPQRGWERIYRDQYRYDRSFNWVCAPNDTHMCRLRAFVRNGVLIRSEQTYDVDRYGDCYGNRTSPAWNPRGCPKGFTFQRRVYGPYRAKGPAIRKGWKRWADDGFPSLSDKPDLRSEYKFDDRGNDEFVRVSWNDAARYCALGLKAVAETYSGDAGRRRLLADGYDPDLLHHWEGAGTTTIKMGSNLPIHGLIGKFGIYRFGNMLGLLDHHVRGVQPEHALGARAWNEYTWRGDQAPGTPFATGLQTSDMDFSDLRFSKMILMMGKNLVENKMAESHWFIEAMERGARIVNVSPDYAAPSAKSDYWIGVRPGLSDLALVLGLIRIIIDNNWHDAEFTRRFTDMPLLVRTDTLKRLRPQDVFADYSNKDITSGPSLRLHGMTADQRETIGDFCMWDTRASKVVAVSRDEVGDNLKFTPALDGAFKVQLASGETIEVMPVFEMYRRHLKDYDVATVAEITGADAALIERLAKDLATIKPAAIHFGEGINHYFHATLHNRACFVLMAITGNIGKHGTGVFSWAGNYKGALLQAGNGKPGVGVYTNEDPFNPVLDETATISGRNIRHCMHHEEPSYWAGGEQILKVSTPEGVKRFTGDTHLPTPTKAFWYNNANFLNQAKWIYDIIVNTLPRVDLIIDQQIEWTGSAEYSDIVFPVNSWAEFEDLELGGSCSNPFIQVWGGDGIKPVADSRDDAVVFGLVANALGDLTSDQRFGDMWKYVLEKKNRVYIQRVLDSCITTVAEDGPYQLDRILRGDYGAPGVAMFLFRTYPRVAFFEQVHDSLPFYTDCGRVAAYCDLDEAIACGENLLVHREGVEATPYLPNVIVSTSPYIRPNDYGIPLDAIDADLRQVRNVKLPWARVKQTVNPLWAGGFHFFCSTPKSRHSTHSSWSTVDWNWIWSTSFSDPYRRDKRAPGVGDRQIQMNPQAGQDLGLNDGDYVYVDANPADRPYRGWQDDEGSFRHRAYRCMVRVKFNPALPYHFTIMKHTGWIASERTVRAHENRADGRALAAGTGYQSSYRYGSHQSITRGWLPPMHQTDSLFHKKTGGMGFVFGADVDNHAVNTVPKETLIRITKAEPGGINGQGLWSNATDGFGPMGRSEANLAYLAGELTGIGSPEGDYGY